MNMENTPQTPEQEIEELRATQTLTRRAVSPGMEEHLYTAIPVLDHGFGKAFGVYDQLLRFRFWAFHWSSPRTKTLKQRLLIWSASN